MSSSLSWRALGAGLAAASIWGGMYVVSKAVMNTVPPLTLLASRLILAIGLLAWWLPSRPRPAWSLWPRVLAVGAVGYGLSLSLQFVGTHLSTAANGALVTTATPAFVYVFARILFREPIPRQRWLALALATVGVLVVMDPRQGDWGSERFVGNVLLAAAALTWALYSVLIGRLAGRADLFWVSVLAFLGGLFLVLPLATLELYRQGGLSGPLTPGVIAGVLFVGWVSTALAMVLWNYAFARLPAGIAGLTFFAQPVVGTLLSTWFLHEPLPVTFWLGAVFIAAGLMLAVRAGP
ncbi:MAG: DMT family transporter [Chloroflexi bacterium]|nr:DMT family transporter [Chloroflexota bacterium]